MSSAEEGIGGEASVGRIALHNLPRGYDRAGQTGPNGRERPGELSAVPGIVNKPCFISPFSIRIGDPESLHVG